MGANGGIPRVLGKKHRRHEGRGDSGQGHESTRLHVLLSVYALPRRQGWSWNWMYGQDLFVRMTKASVGCPLRGLNSL